MYTFLVAAYDAPRTTKRVADFHCSGQNDEQTIRLAFAALPSVGGTIALSEGTFHIDATLLLDRPNVCLNGCGISQTQLLIGTGLQFGVKIAADNMSIRNFWIYSVDGDNGTFALGTHLIECGPNVAHLSFNDLLLEHGRNGLRFNNSKHVTDSDVHCKDLGGQGIGTMGGSTGRAENVLITRAILENVRATGITLNPVKNAIISDILIINDDPLGQGRIDVSSNVLPTENVVISNVIATNAGLLESAVSALEGAGAYPSGIAVSNCVARGYHLFPGIQGAFEDLTLSDVILQSDQARAINIVKASRLKMSNVTVDASGWQDEEQQYCYTVHLENTPGAIIDGLTVISSPNVTSGCLYTTGARSIISGRFQGSRSHAVYLQGDDITLKHCELAESAKNGAWVLGNGINIQDCLLRDNSLLGAGLHDDIGIPGVGALRVSGCRFRSDQVAYHYNETASEGDGCLIESNWFEGSPVTGLMRIRKPNTIARNNVGVTDV